jgi:predicted DNA-binding antitoxin AbrB/MazE fold protein
MRPRNFDTLDPLDSLNLPEFLHVDLKEGERVRIYIAYWGSSSVREVREGVIINPRQFKKKDLSLKLRVERAGIMVDDEPKLKEVDYVKPYLYKNIRRIERL